MKQSHPSGAHASDGDISQVLQPHMLFGCLIVAQRLPARLLEPLSCHASLNHHKLDLVTPKVAIQNMYRHESVAADLRLLPL